MSDERIEDLEQQVSEMESKVEDLENTVFTLETEIEDLKAERQTLTEQRDELRVFVDDTLSSVRAFRQAHTPEPRLSWNDS